MPETPVFTGFFGVRRYFVIFFLNLLAKKKLKNKKELKPPKKITKSHLG